MTIKSAAGATKLPVVDLKLTKDSKVNVADNKVNVADSKVNVVTADSQPVESGSNTAATSRRTPTATKGNAPDSAGTVDGNLSSIKDDFSSKVVDADMSKNPTGPFIPTDLPSPTVDQSGPPTGKGLTTGESGWPAKTITTAGGYHIVPEGKTNWSIYAPDQKHGSKPHTRVWGDPHVTEGDGTRWDFTKDSDFVLGDGTRIFADTNYDPAKGNGQSVTTGLVITNGNDRVDVTNVHGTPDVSDVKSDGLQWRANHVASGKSQDTFHLSGDKKTVHWVRERNGRLDGVVTGAKKQGGIYEQTIDKNTSTRLSGGMRPQFGTEAWSQLAMNQLADADGRNGYFAGNQFGNAQEALFGGLPSYFGSGGQAFHMLQELISLLRSHFDYTRQQRMAQTPNVFA